MIALKTLVAGVALVQGSPASRSQADLDGEGKHSSQFKYFVQDNQFDTPTKLAAAVYRLACRESFAPPGYALIRQTKITSSKAHRESLIELKESLSLIHKAITGQTLGIFSINRFDQKHSSRPHRDGAPAQSLLLVGYEPTRVASELFIADYSACAHQLGLSPVQFLEEFNPMYKKGMDNLAPYVMPLVEYDPSYFNILVINNSSMPLNRIDHYWQGVLHYADINGVGLGARVINSLSLTPLVEEASAAVSEEAVRNFLKSENLSGESCRQT
jgi:hypothetical protein